MRSQPTAHRSYTTQVCRHFACYALPGKPYSILLKNKRCLDFYEMRVSASFGPSFQVFHFLCNFTNVTGICIYIHKYKRKQDTFFSVLTDCFNKTKFCLQSKKIHFQYKGNFATPLLHCLSPIAHSSLTPFIHECLCSKPVAAMTMPVVSAA